MSQDGYIYIVGWDTFQHYKDRRPIWIKTYVELLDKDEYLDLPARDRALLHACWISAGKLGNGRTPAGVGSLRRRFRLRYVQLDLLVEAGFIEVRASKALAARYQDASVEKEKEESSSKEEQEGGASTAEAAHRLNGARMSKRRRQRIAACRRLYQAAIADGEEHSAVLRDLEYTFKDDLAIIRLAVPQEEPAA